MQVAPWERKSDDSPGEQAAGDYYTENSRVGEGGVRVHESRYPYNTDPFNSDRFSADPYRTDPYSADPFNADPYATDNYNYPHSDAESESMASSTMASDVGPKIVDKIDITGIPSKPLHHLHIHYLHPKPLLSITAITPPPQSPQLSPLAILSHS